MNIWNLNLNIVQLHFYIPESDMPISQTSTKNHQKPKRITKNRQEPLRIIKKNQKSSRIIKKHNEPLRTPKTTNTHQESQ